MLTAILIILFVYTVWFVVRPWVADFARRKMRERFERMVRDQFGFTPPRGGDGNKRRKASEQADRRPPKGPKIPDGVGEYVEFEEIDVTYTYTETSSTTRGYDPREPRVSDAEWEDMP
ncbi:MAG: hypothetical protein K2K49_00910 [Duncaniella sp.]|nr:hypothetical protein [Duncaniella sp.]